MGIRPLISAPLPWLAILAGRFLGRPSGHGKRPAFRLPRTLKTTREGKWFISVLFLIGIAAINTGTNLLYLVTAMLLSLIVISGLMSESSLRGVEARRTVPPHVFAKTASYFRIQISNRKRLFPSYCLLIEESLAKGLDAEKPYLLKIKAGKDADAVKKYVFEKRGLARLRGLKVKTGFPFGLFIKGREIEAVSEVLVFPRVQEVEEEWLGQGAISRGEASLFKGGSTELFGLRDYTPSDDSRLIHWKSAARTQRLLAKEFEKEAERAVEVVFMNLDGDGFEEAVERAASLASHFITQGLDVGLRTLSCALPPAGGADQLFSVLRTLALIAPVKEKGRPCVEVSPL